MDIKTQNQKKVLSDLYSENQLEIIKNYDELNAILSLPPNPKWVEVNKYASNSKYLPIDKVEYLLRKIFKKFSIEITGQGQAFNGVWVTVRIHYLDPVSNLMSFHDGIGAVELQTKSGSSPAQLENINKGALMMAFPMAKSYAIKDACDHFGDLFGSNLNRKNTLLYSTDNSITQRLAESQQQNINE